MDLLKKTSVDFCGYWSMPWVVCVPSKVIHGQPVVETIQNRRPTAMDILVMGIIMCDIQKNSYMWREKSTDFLTKCVKVEVGGALAGFPWRLPVGTRRWMALRTDALQSLTSSFSLFFFFFKKLRKGS